MGRRSRACAGTYARRIPMRARSPNQCIQGERASSPAARSMVGQNLDRWRPERKHGVAQRGGQFAANALRTRVALSFRQALGLEARGRQQFLGRNAGNRRMKGALAIFLARGATVSWRIPPRGAVVGTAEWREACRPDNSAR